MDRPCVRHVFGVRDTYGQAARLTTNYDAALLSVLFVAQAPAAVHHERHFCPLRGWSSAEVIRSDVSGSRFAATVTVLMAHASLSDHIQDGDG